MKNRLFPLGYCMDGGEIKVNEEEADIVKTIFSDYINGLSLNRIVGKLNKAAIIFKGNTVAWNKGRLFHILTDRRYLGDAKYPPIITEDSYKKANSARQEKGVGEIEFSIEEKILRSKLYCGICGGKLSKYKSEKNRGCWRCSQNCFYRFCPTEQRILTGILKIANMVVNNPEIIVCEKKQTSLNKTPEIMRLNNEILRVGDQSVPSFNTGKQLVFKLANVKFSNLMEDKSIYTSLVLDEVQRVVGIGKVDQTFLTDAIDKVLLRKKEVAVLFRNGIEIGEKECNKR